MMVYRGASHVSSRLRSGPAALKGYTVSGNFRLPSNSSHRRSRPLIITHAGNAETGVDMTRLSNLISLEPEDSEKRYAMEQIAQALDVPFGTVKNMVFKKKGMLELTPKEITDKISQIAEIVEVSGEHAREMAIIQPGLLFDTEKQAQTLAYGIKAICYELDATKDEVVELILENQSVLHGRELRLSVADMAHLAMLREPRGRIVD